MASGSASTSVAPSLFEDTSDLSDRSIQTEIYGIPFAMSTLSRLSLDTVQTNRIWAGSVQNTVCGLAQALGRPLWPCRELTHPGPVSNLCMCKRQ